MNWKVVVQSDNPAAEALGTLGELTGLNRGELLRALRRGSLAVGDGFDRARATRLAKSLREEFGLEAIALPDPRQGETSGTPTLFRVVLTGFQPGRRASLRRSLERLSSLPPEQVVLWLSRIPFVLRDRVDHTTARRIRRAITDAGGMIDMRPVMESGETVHSRSPAEGESGSRTEVPAGGDSASGPPPAPPRPPARDTAAKSAPPPQLFFLPPPPPEEMEPPPPVALSRTREAGPSPHVFRFSMPRSGFAPPPAVTMEEPQRSSPPPVLRFDEAPETELVAPPEPETAFRVILHRPSTCSAMEVAGALRELLDMSNGQLHDILKSYPAWVASFRSRDRAVKLARGLEMKGATVSVLQEGEMPPVLRAAGGGESFRSWIGSHG